MGVLDAEGLKHLITVDNSTIQQLRRGWAQLVDRAWSN
jgi:hypothetical protein